MAEISLPSFPTYSFPVVSRTPLYLQKERRIDQWTGNSETVPHRLARLIFAKVQKQFRGGKIVFSQTIAIQSLWGNLRPKTRKTGSAKKEDSGVSDQVMMGGEGEGALSSGWKLKILDNMLLHLSEFSCFWLVSITGSGDFPISSHTANSGHP